MSSSGRSDRGESETRPGVRQGSGRCVRTAYGYGATLTYSFRNSPPASYVLVLGRQTLRTLHIEVRASRQPVRTPGSHTHAGHLASFRVGVKERPSSCVNEVKVEGRLGRRWEDLYAECRGDLYRVATYLLGASEAEEIVQDAFERGMRDTAFFERVETPAAWLRTVTVRLAVSRLRRRVLLERLRLRAPEPVDGLPDPELYDALRRLPPTQRGALVLRYFFDADYPEIARAVGLSEKSVGATLTRARAALKEALS